MAKSCSPYVVLLLLLIVFSVDNVRMKVEGAGGNKTCRVAWQGCKIEQECIVQCYQKYGGRGSCFKPPGTFFIECLCEYPC
ncbi:hypothetical protein MKW94_005099 [Papaver nudicaule]|uniref:Uncharacterized protein n=1 Tax=Papaver nudicaule TaxID=74823 RepID=A0AA41VMF8_PAPNU|nr:hypothetical protein [Papaver nudicaule]